MFLPPVSLDWHAWSTLVCALASINCPWLNVIQAVMGSSVPNGFSGLDAPRCKEKLTPRFKGSHWLFLASLGGHCLILNNENLLIIILIIGPHVGAGQSARCFKRKQVWKREKEMSRLRCLWGEFVYMRSVFTWVGTWGWMEEKEGARPGLYLLQLRWITKLLPWANHSKRLTNTTTEPIILDTEIGNWYLLVEREMIRGKGSFLTPTCSMWKTVFPYVLLFLLFFPFHKMTTKSLVGDCHGETTAWSDRRGDCLSRRHK